MASRDPSYGFVFGATGTTYRQLAIRAAHSVRQHHPDVPIDLFTDSAVDDPVFDMVHLLSHPTIRPKFAALRDSRFMRTVYLDADVVAVASVADIFDLLERYDLALCHDQWRNCIPSRKTWEYTPPPAFPQLNGGVVALSASDRTRAFVDRWEAGFEAHGAHVDQPALRQILWEDQSLRLAILPEEYNFWDSRRLDRMTTRHAAPRILHSNMFRRPRMLAAPDIRTALIRYLGHRRMAWLEALLAADGTLHGGPPEPHISRAKRIGMALTCGLRDLPHKVRVALGWH